MALSQNMMTRPNALLVGALVLTVGTVICYTYLSKSSPPKGNARSIPSAKKGTQEKKVSEAASDDAEQSTSKTKREETDADAVAGADAAEGVKVPESTSTAQEVPAVKEAPVVDAKPAATEKEDAVVPDKDVSAAAEATVPQIAAVHTRAMKSVETESEPAAAVEKRAESKPAAEPKDDEEEKETETETETAAAAADAEPKERSTQSQEDGAAPSSPTPVASSSTTSSSSASGKQIEEPYPASTLTTPSAPAPKSSTYWQQPNNEPMPQYSIGWPSLISIPEFRPQYLQQQQPNQNQQQSLYSVDAGNTVAAQGGKPPRGKKGRRGKKRLSRIEMIEEQRQTHTPPMKSRCDYWPYCSNRNCKFRHPVKPCRAGDACSFGNRCMFLHPRDYYD